jgi:hypothetical protein
MTTPKITDEQFKQMTEMAQRRLEVARPALTKLKSLVQAIAWITSDSEEVKPAIAARLQSDYPELVERALSEDWFERQDEVERYDLAEWLDKNFTLVKGK